MVSRALIFITLVAFAVGASTGFAQSGSKQIEGDVRSFYRVLDDLLSDFEFDLKNGQVQGLRDLSIRNILSGENVPPSFRNHLELVLTERILRNSNTQVIQCLPCKARKLSVASGDLHVVSNDANPIEMARVARSSGILNFMDVAFTFQSQSVGGKGETQPGAMVLSLLITDPQTGSTTWSRSYNSEISRASQLRRGVDNSSLTSSTGVVPGEPAGTSRYQYRMAVQYTFEPNFSGTTGVIGGMFRMMERYDLRTKEVGFEAQVEMDASPSVTGATPTTTTTNLFKAPVFSLLFMHAWNLFGEEENLNGARGSLFGGLGGSYGSGFLGGLVKAGFEWRMARHWAASIHLGFRPSSTTSTGGTISGANYGIAVNYLF